MYFDKHGGDTTAIEETYLNIITKGRTSIHDVSLSPRSNFSKIAINKTSSNNKEDFLI